MLQADIEARGVSVYWCNGGGLDGILYAESDLFEQYDFEIDDGHQVIYAKKAGD